MIRNFTVCFPAGILVAGFPQTRVENKRVMGPFHRHTVHLVLILTLVSIVTAPMTTGIILGI
jgi:hypothetical protein